MSNYWLEALECALDECGCFNALTDEQRKEVAASLAHSAEMESEATGRLCIPNPMKAELEQQQRRADTEAAHIEQQSNVWRETLARHLRIPANRLYINNGQVFIGD